MRLLPLLIWAFHATSVPLRTASVNLVFCISFSFSSALLHCYLRLLLLLRYFMFLLRYLVWLQRDWNYDFSSFNLVGVCCVFRMWPWYLSSWLEENMSPWVDSEWQHCSGRCWSWSVLCLSWLSAVALPVRRGCWGLFTVTVLCLFFNV